MIGGGSRRVKAAFWGLVTAAIGLVFLGCSGRGDGTRPVIHVAAAASTVDLFEALIRDYTAAVDVDIRLNAAASSVLARQITAGLPFDVFVSANPAWMDDLQGRGLIDAASRLDWLDNRLVLIAAAGVDPGRPMAEGRDLAAVYPGRLALADPSHVPAGIYARQALDGLGWSAGFEGRLVPTADVRAALSVVASGEVGLGLVYASDAAASTRVHVVETVPLGLHDPIRYPLALSPKASPAARAFYAYLVGSRTAEIRADAGFLTQ